MPAGAGIADNGAVGEIAVNDAHEWEKLPMVAYSAVELIGLADHQYRYMPAGRSRSDVEFPASHLPSMAILTPACLDGRFASCAKDGRRAINHVTASADGVKTRRSFCCTGYAENG